MIFSQRIALNFYTLENIDHVDVLKWPEQHFTFFTRCASIFSLAYCACLVLTRKRSRQLSVVCIVQSIAYRYIRNFIKFISVICKLVQPFSRCSKFPNRCSRFYFTGVPGNFRIDFRWKYTRFFRDAFP